MLKNIKYYIDGTGIDWMGIFSLGVFFIFFVVLLLYVLYMKKDNVEQIRNIPLQDEPEAGEKNSTYHGNL